MHAMTTIHAGTDARGTFKRLQGGSQRCMEVLRRWGSGGRWAPQRDWGRSPEIFWRVAFLDARNNFTNLTRLSSVLLLDLLLLIDMTWNTHFSAKNTDRKRNILGDREKDKRRVGQRRRSWTMLDLTGFRLRDRRKSLQKLMKRITLVSFSTPSLPPETNGSRKTGFNWGKGVLTLIFHRWQKEAFSAGSSFFTNWAGLFLLRFFPFFSFSFRLFFFFFWTRLLTLRNLQ